MAQRKKDRMLGKLNRFARRLIRRNPEKYEVVIRSESNVEVLEKMLERKLDHESAADMGLLDSFAEMNKRLANAPPAMQERIRLIWREAILDMRKQDTQTTQQQSEIL